MAVITLDFETYYDNEFSLRHMTYEQYVRDPRFEAIMCSIHIPSEKELYWVKGDEIGKELQRLELHKNVQIAHNNAFDAFILNDHFGISAAGYGCTMQMARVAKNAEGSMSLDNLSKENNLKPKGTFVQNMLGVRARDMSESQWRDYGDYCLTDSENCSSLYRIYRPYFSTQDLNLISETLRWGAECKFVLNEQLLEDYVERLKVRRETRLELLADAYNVDTTKLRSMLRSSKTFAQMLRDQGVEPPTKINDKGNETYAFAKTDLEFKELAEHPSQRVVDLYETKVGTQSSIAETRAATFLQIAKRGKMPFPLVPFKAVTGRHGAAQKLNCFAAGHELLTPSGWVKVEDYIEGTPLLQVDLDTGRASWDEQPLWLHKKYDGLLVDIDATAYKMCVTGDHRIPYYRPKSNTWTYKLACDVGRLDNLPYKAELQSTLSQLDISDVEVQYLVALQADGSVTKSHAHTFGFKKARKIERLCHILNSIGVVYTMRTTAQGVTLISVLHKNQTEAMRIGKGYGSWVLSLSAEQRNLLLDELVHWDGYANSNSGGTEFYSGNKEQAMWVHTLYAITGRGAKMYDYSTERCGKYVVYEKSSQFTSITQADVSHRMVTGEDVYCPKVATDAVLVRYKDTIAVVHQCQNLPARGDDTYLRQSMGAPKDHAVVTNDLAQVEARRLAALAGELRLVEQFYRGDDVYSLFGTTMFKYEVSKATPRERAIAKECLAEGTLILTDVGLIPIEKIKLTHRLWDGVSWVKHDGLIYQGVREVITYDGITATPDHEVFCVDGMIRTLGQAQQCGVALVSTGLGEQAIPFSDRGFTACSDRQRLSLYTSQVHDNKAIKVGVLRHSDVGSKQEFYTQRTGGSPLLQAGEPSMDGDARSVQQPTKPCVSQVRWAWDKVSSRARRIVSMGIKNLRGKELRFFSANRDRPCGQQRALRAIQSSFFHTFTKFAEPIKHFVCFVGRCGYTSSGVGVPLCSDTYIQSNQTWYDGRADSRGCSMFNTQPLQGLETVTKKVAVYDIANVGAAKRFTANGKLVLNCILSSGFGAGWRSFQTRMKGAYGVSMTDEEAQYYIRHYREVHTRITNFWEQCTTAIRTMYKGGEYKFGDNDELTAVKGEIIFADGWRLRYDDIKFEGYDQYGREQYSYYSHRHRSRKHLYSGLVANNVTQGTAARILHWHLFELRKRGKIMSGAVHDELISVVHYKEVFDYYEEMTSVMRTTPEWAKNTPLDCEFELGLNYGTLTDIKTFTQQHYDDLRKYHPTDLLDRYAA